jgi:hypothetical protein
MMTLAVFLTAGASRGFAYDADELEVFGFGPGLTVLIGLAPPTPSAMAFRMSTSTCSSPKRCPSPND